MIVFHHLILDGWSTHALIGRLIDDYENGGTATRQDEFSYRRYIEWMIGQNQDAAAEFWKQQLAGFKTCNEIGSRKISQDNESRYLQDQIVLSPSRSQALREFARLNRVTLNTVMQAAWSILVSRYAGGDN